MIKAGLMREVITIEQPGTPGTLGQATWVPFASGLRASLSLFGRKAASESSNAAGLGGADVSHLFTLRYIAGVTVAMRVTMSGRIFHIVAPMPLDEGTFRQLEIYCREVLTA